MKLKEKKSISRLRRVSIASSAVIIAYGSILPNITVKAAVNSQENYKGSILNYKSAIPVVPFQYTLNEKYSGVLSFNKKESVSYALEFKNSDSNKFNVKKTNPDQIDYYYNGYYGEWSDKIPSGGKIEMYTFKGGFYDGKWIDVKTTVYFDDFGYVMMSGRDYLAVPSKNAHIKYEFFEHNENVDETKVLDNIMGNKNYDEWENFLKTRKKISMSGSLGLYDFDTTNKTMTFDKKNIDNIFYSITQKDENIDKAMTIDDSYGKVKISSAKSIKDTESNNVNNMVAVTFSNQDHLNIISTGGYWSSTVGYTKDKIVLEPLAKYVVSKENNQLNAYQYVPARFDKYNKYFIPEGNPMPLDKFEEEIIISDMNFIDSKLNDTSNQFSLKSSNFDDKTNLIISPKNLNDSNLYGKLFDLEVDFKNKISVDDLKKDSELKNKFLNFYKKYYDVNDNVLKIPAEFKFKYKNTVQDVSSGGKSINVTLDKNLKYYLDVEILKDKTKEAIDNKAKVASEEINKLANLTLEEKEKFNKEIDVEVNKTKENINNANTLEGVNKSEKDGEKAIDEIVNKAKEKDVKNKAKGDIDNKAKLAKDEINKLPNLTQEEKDKAIKEIDDEANKAKAAIDKAENPEAIDNAVKSGEKAIDDVVNEAKAQDAKNKAAKDLKDAKDLASKEIAQKAENTNKAIDSLVGVDEKTKAEAKAKVNKAKENAEKAINASTDIENVNKALEAGKKAIDDIYNGIDKTSKDNINNAKNKAKGDIDNKAKLAKDEINKLPNLTQEEKDKAIKAIDDEANKAKENKNGFLPKVSLSEKVKTGDPSNVPYIFGILGSLGLLGVFKSKKKK